MGALFGLGPPLVALAGADPDRIGAPFWAGAFAALAHAYVRDRIDARHALLLGAGVWGCFWSAPRDVAPMLVLLAAAAAVLEAARVPGARRPPRRRLALWLPALAGAATLVVAPWPRDAAPGAAWRLLAPESSAGLAPFAWFLALIAAAEAAARPARARGASMSAALAAAALVALAAVWPRVDGAPVRRLVSRIERGRTDHRWRTLVVPRGAYRPADDTYQIAVGGPFVHSVALAEAAPELHEDLARRFPRVYRDQSQVWDAAWGRELRALEVGYLIVPDREHLGRLPGELQQSVFMAGPDGFLVALR